mgnify:CR=1 FL=1
MGMNDKHDYEPTKWVDNSEPDIDAEHLNKIESALQEYGASIDELAATGGTAAKVKVTDTYGLVVDALGESTAQALIDAIANKVVNELINKNKIVNNLLATDASTVLAGTQGAALDKRLVAAENAVTQLNSDLGKQYWSLLETYNVSVINSWNRGTKSITLPAGAYIIGQRSDVNCSNSIYLDTRIDTFKQDLPLYEKALNIPATTARNNATEYRSCNNTFAMGFSKETTLYFFCWADSPITIQYEIWAIKIK